MDAISLKILKFPVISIFLQKVWAVLLSPVMSIYFRTFPKKRHGKTRHIMGSHGISRHFHGKVRTKGGLHLN
jgi:hypothetical protein